MKNKENGTFALLIVFSILIVPMILGIITEPNNFNHPTIHDLIFRVYNVLFGGL